MAKNNTLLYVGAAVAALFLFRKQLGIGGPADFEAADELELFIENDRDLYNSIVYPTYQNLARKIQSGKYSSDLAQKSFYRIATLGAKKYHKQFGTPGTRFGSVFTVPTRKMTAASMERNFYGDWKNLI